MLSYFEEILAEQSVLMAGQEGDGYFESSSFFLGEEKKEMEEGGLLFRRGEQGLLSDSVLPWGIGTESLLPGGNGTESLLPGGNGTESLLPGGNGTENLLPEGLGAESLLPGGLGAESLLPGGIGTESLLPGGIGTESLLPGGNGSGGYALGREGLKLGKVEPLAEEALWETGHDFGRGSHERDLLPFLLAQRLEEQKVLWSDYATLVGGEGFGRVEDSVSVVAQEIPGALAESAMGLERQILEMAVENPLVSRRDWALSQEGDLWREMVRLEEVASVLPQEGAEEVGSGSNRGWLVEGGQALLPWAVEKRAVVLSGRSDLQGMEAGDFDARESATSYSLGGEGLLTQIRNLETATVGKGRLEREVLASRGSDSGGRSLGESWSHKAGVTVADFDRAVARDARRYDGI